MYQRNDRVIYGIHGVCTIIDMEILKIDGKAVEYYVLSPVDQPDARFYVPTQNKAAVAKLRPLLSKEALDALLHDPTMIKNNWIQDENERKQRYRELINSGDRVEMVKMVYTLHIHRKKLNDVGRKFHLCDENFLRDAEKLLKAEFSIILSIPQDQVKNYIHETIGM